MCASSNALTQTVLASARACCAGDTSSSSGYEEIEAIPTAQGLRFGDLPSPSGSEFGTPGPQLPLTHSWPPSVSNSAPAERSRTSCHGRCMDPRFVSIHKGASTSPACVHALSLCLANASLLVPLCNNAALALTRLKAALLSHIA